MKHFFFSCFAIAMLNFASCNQTDKATGTTTTTTPSPEERNIKMIKASYDGVNQHNVDVMLKDAAPELTDYGDGSSSPIRNSDSAKLMIEAWFKALPDYKCENTQYFASGNKVAVISYCSGTWKSDYMGLNPSGKAFKFQDADIFTFNDKGQIIEHRSIQNMGPVLASIGMKMSQPMADRKR